jgi:hypothetical protein
MRADSAVGPVAYHAGYEHRLFSLRLWLSSRLVRRRPDEAVLASRHGEKPPGQIVESTEALLAERRSERGRALWRSCMRVPRTSIGTSTTTPALAADPSA